jgi:hypothetical protein
MIQSVQLKPLTYPVSIIVGLMMGYLIWRLSPNFVGWLVGIVFAYCANCALVLANSPNFDKTAMSETAKGIQMGVASFIFTGLSVLVGIVLFCVLKFA